MVISMAMLSVSAQEKVKQKELGLVFRNFDNFGIIYKFGDQNSMWRLKSVYGYSYKNDLEWQIETNSLKENNHRISFGISFGKQYTVPIDEKFSFIYGADVMSSYNYSFVEREIDSDEAYTTTSEGKNLRLGLNLVLGFNYLIGENFVLGFELLPGASYSIGKQFQKSTQESVEDEEYNISAYLFGLSSSSALLNFAYRF